MSPTFAIGEIAILKFCPDGEANLHKYAGGEVEIIDNQDVPWFDEYRIKAPDGCCFYAKTAALQKRPPPPQREATSTWDDVAVWRPKKTEAEA